MINMETKNNGKIRDIIEYKPVNFELYDNINEAVLTIVVNIKNKVKNFLLKFGFFQCIETI